MCICANCSTVIGVFVLMPLLGLPGTFPILPYLHVREAWGDFRARSEDQRIEGVTKIPDNLRRSRCYRERTWRKDIDNELSVPRDGAGQVQPPSMAMGPAVQDPTIVIEPPLTFVQYVLV